MANALEVREYIRGDYWAVSWMNSFFAGNVWTNLLPMQIPNILRINPWLIIQGLSIRFNNSDGGEAVSISPRIYTDANVMHYLDRWATVMATNDYKCYTGLNIPITPGDSTLNAYPIVRIEMTVEDNDGIYPTIWGTYQKIEEQAQITPVSVESITWFPKKPKVGVI